MEIKSIIMRKQLKAVLFFAKLISQDEEIGIEKTLSLLSKWIIASTKIGFQRKKDELAITDTTPNAWYNVARAFDEDQGCKYEIIEKKPDYIKHKILNCPIPEACSSIGWDDKIFCEKVILPINDEVAAIVNPKLRWVGKYGPKTGCEYEIYYK